MFLRVLKNWIHIYTFVSKAGLLVTFFQKGGHRAGLSLHGIKTRGQFSQFHQTTGQFCGIMVQLEGHSQPSQAPPVPTQPTTEREATHPTQRAASRVITHVKFMTGIDADGFRLNKTSLRLMEAFQTSRPQKGCSDEASP